MFAFIESCILGLGQYLLLFQVDITPVNYMNVFVYAVSTFNVQHFISQFFRSLEVFLTPSMLALKIYKLQGQ